MIIVCRPLPYLTLPYPVPYTVPFCHAHPYPSLFHVVLSCPPHTILPSSHHPALLIQPNPAPPPPRPTIISSRSTPSYHLISPYSTPTNPVQSHLTTSCHPLQLCPNQSRLAPSIPTSFPPYPTLPSLSLLHL